MVVHGEAAKEHISSDSRCVSFGMAKTPKCLKTILCASLWQGGRPLLSSSRTAPTALRCRNHTAGGAPAILQQPQVRVAGMHCLKAKGLGVYGHHPRTGAGVGVGAWMLRLLPASTGASVHLDWSFEPAWTSSYLSW